VTRRIACEQSSIDGGYAMFCVSADRQKSALPKLRERTETLVEATFLVLGLKPASGVGMTRAALDETDGFREATDGDH
jgi:hypothetical protein